MARQGARSSVMVGKQGWREEVRQECLARMQEHRHVLLNRLRQGQARGPMSPGPITFPFFYEIH